MGRREEPAWSKGTVGLMAARERGDIDRQFSRRLMVTRDNIDRLGLEKELNGHMGCVNCLEWSKDGTILASASDDLHVNLWDPFRHKLLQNIPTGHTGNIFSVKFPRPDALATCAADGKVRVRSCLDAAPLLECSCHSGRVKRLATAPDNPHLVWSAGEDGVVLQHDLRAAHRCDAPAPNVLVNLLNHVGRYGECKCAAVNPRRAEQLAIGANDAYVRLYDMRMLRPARLHAPHAGTSSSRLMWERQSARCARAGQGDPDDNIPRAAVRYFAPGHLSMEPNEHTFPKKAITYVSFSDDGNELLVNLGSEQVYIFDVNSTRRPVLLESFIIERNHGNHDSHGEQPPAAGAPPRPPPPGARDRPPGGPLRNGTTAPPADQLGLSPHAVELKEMAKEYMNQSAYSRAVELYNEAVSASPGAAVLYSNRAAALMRRGWSGDLYAAIKDCYLAIKLDPANVKSHFRLAKALMDMKRAREAHECLLYFKERFPRHANNHAVFLLQKDINTALEAMDRQQPDEAPPDDEAAPTSPLERQCRAAAADYTRRFLGHCNTTTDIKEACFLGPDAMHIAAGSDDGSIFIWSRATGNIVRVLRGDESIVNCLQLHPTLFLLASSGIEPCVRLWSPRPQDGTPEPRLVPDARAAAAANQQRLRSDPFEAMLLNIGFVGDGERDLHSPACRAS